MLMLFSGCTINTCSTQTQTVHKTNTHRVNKKLFNGVTKARTPQILCHEMFWIVANLTSYSPKFIPIEILWLAKVALILLCVCTIDVCVYPPNQKNTSCTCHPCFWIKMRTNHCNLSSVTLYIDVCATFLNYLSEVT